MRMVICKRVSDVGQIETHTAEPVVPEPSPKEVEIATAKLKRYQSPSRDQIPAEMIQSEGEILRAKIHKLILFRIRKTCLVSGTRPLLHQFTRRVIKLTVVIIVGYHCYQLHTTCYPISLSEGQVHILMKLLGIISLGIDITDQLLIRSFAFVNYWRRNGSTIRQYISYL
jgi:hypothetical protein